MPEGANKITDTAKIVGEKWKKLPAAEQEKYKKLFEQKQKAYKIELEKFNKEQAAKGEAKEEDE